MKRLTLLLLLFASITFAQLHQHYYNYRTIDTNNISADFDNIGSFPDGSVAFWSMINSYPYNDIVYCVSPWIVGKFNGEPAAAIKEAYSLYSPGPIINGQAGIIVQPEDSLTFRIYKISKGDDNSNPDYAEWPDTLGAPVDQNGDPLVYGDQTLWTVYNAVDTSVYRNLWNDYFPPVPVEIRQTVFAHAGNNNDIENIFSNVIFMEYTIINKGEQSIDSAYFGLWSDIDFDAAIINYPAVDSAAEVAYCWSDTNFILDINPAVGFQLLYGPVINFPGDTAIFKGRQLSGYKNIPMTSFHGIGDDSEINELYGPIRSLNNAWNAARGFDLDGNVIINPITNTPTRFPVNGDPVTRQGWYQFPRNWVGGMAGGVFFSGPFNLAPQDTQWAMVALVPGLGRNDLESIVNMRQKAAILHSLPYDSLVWGNPYYGINDVKDKQKNIVPDRFTLLQNYPNPFNPVTTIIYSVAANKIEDKITLKVYDMLGREVAVLVNEVETAGSHIVKYDASKLASGVYFYQLRAGSFIETKKMLLLK
jgi:hypothetical protein